MLRTISTHRNVLTLKLLQQSNVPPFPTTVHTKPSGQHGKGRAIITKHEAKFERLRQTGSTHRSLSLNRHAHSETKPTTSSFSWTKFSEQHVQCVLTVQGYLCHLPVLQEEGNCVARSMQRDDKQGAITLVVFTRAARRTGAVAVHPPRVLLGHHVQPNPGACFHCFNWDARPKPNHRISLRHSIGRRLCAAAHCPKHPALVIAALLSRSLELVSVLTFHAL